MPKVSYNSSKGLVQEAGSGINFSSDSIVFSSLPTSAAQTVSTSATITTPGVYTLTASEGVLTAIMPLASAVPGGQFVFRSTSPSAHVLTGSQEAQGTKVFAGQPGIFTAIGGQGSRLTLPGVEGSSIALISDGKSFLLMAA